MKGVKNMSKTYPVITVTRNVGSNGRTIAKILARELQIPFYDNEIIEIAAKESNFDPKLFQKMENTRAANSFLYAINRLGAGSTYNVPLSDQLFSATSSVIRKIAETHPAVVVGRCADYILRDCTRTLNIFVQAETPFRIQNTMKNLSISEPEAESYNKKHDRSQAAYYNFYTDRKFGAKENYDLVLNSTNLDREEAARFLKRYVEMMLGDELEEAKREAQINL